MSQKFIDWENLAYVLEQLRKETIDHASLDEHLDAMWETRERVTNRMKYSGDINVATGLPYTLEDYNSDDTTPYKSIVGVNKHNLDQDRHLELHEQWLNGHDTRLDGHDTRLTAIEGENAGQNGRLDAIENKNTEQNGRLDAIENKNTEQNGRLDAIENKNTEQNGRLDNIDNRLKGLEDMGYRSIATDGDIDDMLEENEIIVDPVDPSYQS